MAIPTEQSILTALQINDDRTRTKNDKNVDHRSSSSSSSLSLSYIIGTIVVGLMATIYLASGGSTSGTHLLFSTTNNNDNEAAAAAVGESALLRSTGTNKKGDSTCRKIRYCQLDFAGCYGQCSMSCGGECGGPGGKPIPGCVERCQGRCRQNCEMQPNKPPRSYYRRRPNICPVLCGTACLTFTGGTGFLCGFLYCNGDTIYRQCDSSYSNKCWANIEECQKYYKPVY